MFARQLNALCARSEQRVTNIRLVQALADRGCRISALYLSQLRSGAVSDPPVSIVEALADYFGVQVDYFFTPAIASDASASLRADFEVQREFQDTPLHRLFARVQGLSVVSLNLLIDFADRLRIVETLPKFSAEMCICNCLILRDSEFDPRTTRRESAGWIGAIGSVADGDEK